MTFRFTDPVPSGDRLIVHDGTEWTTSSGAGPTPVVIYQHDLTTVFPSSSANSVLPLWGFTTGPNEPLMAQLADWEDIYDYRWLSYTLGILGTSDYRVVSYTLDLLTWPRISVPSGGSLVEFLADTITPRGGSDDEIGIRLIVGNASAYLFIGGSPPSAAVAAVTTRSGSPSGGVSVDRLRLVIH